MMFQVSNVKGTMVSFLSRVEQKQEYEKCKVHVRNKINVMHYAKLTCRVVGEYGR